MFAPRRVPPCLIASVAASNTRMNETGPDATPPVAEHAVALGTQAAEGEAGAAARLVDQRRVLDRVEDALHRVGDGEHEAGRELLERPAGVAQRRRVGQEAQRGHQIVEALLDRRDLRLRGAVPLLGQRDVVRDAPEELLRRLDDAAGAVLGQIAPLEHRAGVRRKLCAGRASAVGPR